MGKTPVKIKYEIYPEISVQYDCMTGPYSFLQTLLGVLRALKSVKFTFFPYIFSLSAAFTAQNSLDNSETIYSEMNRIEPSILLNQKFLPQTCTLT